MIFVMICVVSFLRVVFLNVIIFCIEWWMNYGGSYSFFSFFFFLLGWTNSPIHCLPEGPCWYCDNIVKEKSKCWSPNEGKWKKWYLWWFVWFLSLELSFWLWLFFVLGDEWIMIVILSLFSFFFSFRMEQLPYTLPARMAMLILWKCCLRKKQTLMPNGR